MYDIAIIGGGAAGLSAAVTARARNKKVLVFEGSGFSPSLYKAHLVNNYLGMPNISGKNMIEQFVVHAKEMGTEFQEKKVINISSVDDIFTIITADGAFHALSVILTIGVSKTQSINGEKEFLGRGVSYCATCDGMFFKGQKVAVVSNLEHALPEVQFLAEVCSDVLFITDLAIPEDKFASNVKIVNDKIENITGTTGVNAIEFKNSRVDVHGVFIIREADPVENILSGIKTRGKSIMVDDLMATNITGVFAAGDCTGQPWQISRATGQGQIAALSAINYLAHL